MAKSLDRQFGEFLRKQRGDLTYSEFSRKLGVSQSTIHRIELGQQSVTLARMELILKKLKCRVGDVFE